VGDLLVSVSGIRGVVGDSLTPEVALKYGRVFGKYLKEGDVVLGRDTRYHGPMIFSAVSAGLMASGCNVIDIGVVTTPTVEFAVNKSGSAGGMAITASHNPIEYNALKLIGSKGTFLTESQIKRLIRLYNQADGFKGKNVGSSKKVGSYCIQEGWDLKHVKAILDLDIINPFLIKRKKFRVVVDCVNGATSYISAELFNALGCVIKLINAIPDGRFPRPPEPVSENLKKLCRQVRLFEADVGFAFDPDGDRVAIVDNKGKPLGEEYTLALGMRYILTKKKGPVAINISSSMINDYVAREAGVRIYRTRVGEINVTEKLRRIGGVVGGEGNGGLIYPDMHYGRDGLMAVAVILQYMASSGKTVLELAEEIPRTHMLKRKVSLTGKRVNFNRIEKVFGGGKIDRRDGLKIIFDDSWLQLRLSNTEPVVRIISEAFDYGKAKELADTVEKMIY